MKTFKVIILLVISALLLLSGWVYIAGIGMERAFLNAGFYRSLLSKVAVYDYLIDVFKNNMQEEMDENREEEGANELSEVMMSAFINAADKEWFEEQFFQAVDGILAWVKGKQDGLTVTIDLRQFKDRLQEALLTNLNELSDELFDEPHDGGIEGMVEEILQEMDLPDQIYLAEMILEGDHNQEIEKNMARIRLIRSCFLYTPYLLFGVFLLCSCLLAGPAGGMKWFGAAVLSSGGTFFLGLQVCNGMLLKPLILGLENDLPVPAQVMLSAARFTLSRWSHVALLVAGGGLLFLGSGIVLGIIMRKKKKAK